MHSDSITGVLSLLFTDIDARKRSTEALQYSEESHLPFAFPLNLNRSPNSCI